MNIPEENEKNDFSEKPSRNPFGKALRYYKKFWKGKKGISFWAVHSVATVFFLFLVVYSTSIKAPTNFPEKSMFLIEEGDVLSEVSEKLYNEGFIKSPFWFKNLVILLRGEGGIRAGEYYFDNSQGALQIAKRFIKGDLGLTPIRITIPEGLNVFEIATLLEKNFAYFDSKEFVSLAEEKEGYLFPDTYFFPPNAKAKEFVKTFEDNFNQKISGIIEKIDEFGEPLEKVITVASIIETEARDPDSRRIISGVIWKRLDIGMALQVDVTFKYINGKNSFELTSEDLKIDSPYNSYLYPGLPPTPIANPGLDAILAAIEPTQTDYLYFLADKEGNIYYAVSHDDHVENKNRYLK